LPQGKEKEGIEGGSLFLSDWIERNARVNILENMVASSMSNFPQDMYFYYII
jgi:hypothetical protein